MSTELTHRDLFGYFRDNKRTITNSPEVQEAVFQFINSKVNPGNSLPDDLLLALKKKTGRIINVLVTKWKKNAYSERRFVVNENKWLNLKFEVPKREVEPKPGPSKRPGRPSKEFSEAASRTKQRQTAVKASTITTPQSVAVTRYKLQKKGKRAESSVLQEMSVRDIGKDIKRTLFRPTHPIPLTSEQALAHIMQNSLTKQQYINIRLQNNQQNADIYPVYSSVLEAKKMCYPQGVIASDKGCEVPLQALLDHTSKRIFKVIREIEKKTIDAGEYEVVYKYGIDGTSDQARYRQKFENVDPTDIDETSLLVVSIVPLQVIKKNNDQSEAIIWINTSYSSPLFCRPISFEFQKETNENTQEKHACMVEQIAGLAPNSLEGASVTHRLLLTMINGKAISALTEVSSQSCQICGAKPSEMNQLDRADIVGDPTSIGYVISVLHTNIRMFELILHVAYRLQVQTWRVSSDEDKKIMQETKTRIQNRFKEETGLLIDVVLQGKGTTNDGNTARRFFKDVAKSAEITGVDVDLIKRFSVILKAINSGKPINVANFKAYALNTATKFVELYPWYYLPAHTHKLLLHGAYIIQNSLLPLGMLSEEASEAANKLYRKFRLGYTLKTSRTRVNQDLINRLLISSDPYISSIRRKQTRKNLTPLDDEVLNLLQAAEAPAVVSEEKGGAEDVSEGEEGAEDTKDDDDDERSNEDSEDSDD